MAWPTQEEKEQIRQMSLNGMTIEGISKETGRATQTVRGIQRQMGVYKWFGSRSFPPYKGPEPGFGETAIYTLSRPNLGVFYVGRTYDPWVRTNQHRHVFGAEIELSVIKIVKAEDGLYWECRTIVEYIDRGIVLENSLTPHKGEKRTNSTGSL